MDWKVFVVLLAVVQGLEGNPLGRPFSILHGLKPVLPVESDFNSVFYPVKKTKLFKSIQHDTVQTNFPYFSDFVQLTYHPDDKDLIKTFFSIWKFEDETRDAAPFTYQPSLGDVLTSTKETYATLLGISSENMVGKSYVLARYVKKLETLTMKEARFSDLKPSAFSPDSTSDQITNLFAEHGTHYLAGYEMGDMIYQVFVYDKEKTEDILKFPFDNPTYSFGIRGNSFRQFTQSINQGSKGFCREAGEILSASGDPELANIMPQLNDEGFKVSKSIFMFPVNSKAYELMENLSGKIPLKLYFKPIINKLQLADSLAISTWNDVLSATIYQKFGDASSPDFPAVTAPAAQDLYNSFNPDLVTATATNYVTITRMTFRLDDFSVLDPEYVTHLFIFADVLKISQTAKLNLPGSQKIYLVCREFVALSSGNNVPEIIVGSTGKSDPVIKIIAKEFRGILKVSQANQGTHLTYANKLVYKTVRHPNMQDMNTVKTDNSKKLLYPNKQTLPELYDTTDKSHEGNWLRASLVNSFELAVVSVETILAVPASSDSAENTAGKTLEWITKTLTRNPDQSTHLSVDLEMVLARALLIERTKLPAYAKSRLIVPKLAFSEYKPLYQNILSEVKAYETTFSRLTNEIQRRRQIETTTTSLAELNTNVKSIGSFLVEQAEVNAKHQTDIANTQQSLHDLEKDQIDREKAKASQLLTEIIELQNNVETTGESLKNAIKQYEKEQIVKAVFSVVQVIGSLFTGGVGLANIDKTLEGIVRVAEKVNKVMGIIEQVEKLYDLGINMRNDIGTINRALENIPSGKIDVDNFPTDLEWDDFDSDVYSYTTPGGFLPGQVAGEALDFQRAAKRLSARGRKYISIAANIATIQYKQIQIEMERDLAKRQSNRLRELKTKLTQTDISDNDAKTTDLFELGNIIKTKENQVRSQLVQTFVVMDAALQYYYLQNPTVIEQFDTMAIQRAASLQLQSSIAALDKLPSPPKDLKDPVEFNVRNVPVENLLSKDGYKVSIPLSSLPFHEYVRVRILRIEVRADNILKSAENTVYIQSTASGESFEDRDLDRSPRSYSTFPTEYRTVYNIKTGETIGNPSEQFSNKFIKITPFDDWVFRIPKVTTNKGIQFKTALTTLRIKFYLRVIFQPAVLPSNDRYSGKKLSDNVLGSKDYLLGKMDGRSLVREWDAIMAVNADRVNQIWKKQYDDKTNADFVEKIVTDRRVSTETRSFKVESRVIMNVGPPMIQFIPNNQDRASLKIKIKTGGTVEYWETNKRSGNVDNYNETLTVNEQTAVSGTMNLVKLRGSLSEDKVVLDLSNGVFDLISLDGLDDDTMISFRNEIKKFFNTKLKSENYELSKITYEKSLTPSSLVPDKFYLKTGGFGTPENSGSGSLFIFFRTHSTGSTAHEQTKRDFNDPLSIDQQIIPTGYEVALFIHNRIIFKDIIAEDIRSKFGFGVHTKVLPGKSTSASQQSLYVVGDSDASRTLTMTIPFDRYPDIHGFQFRIPANTLQAKSINQGKKIQVHWVNSGLGISVPYMSHTCGRTFCYDVKEHKTVTFTTSFIRTYTPSIDNQQTITYKEEGSGSASSSALSGWDSFWLGSEVKSAKNSITSNVNGYMSGLRFNFGSISSFAITQVLFPGSNVFRLTDVYIPGDMVILGSVNTD